MSERQKLVLNFWKETTKSKFEKSFTPLLLLCIFGLTSQLWYIFLPLLIAFVFIHHKYYPKRNEKDTSKFLKNSKKVYLVAYFPIALACGLGLTSKYQILSLVTLIITSILAFKLFQEEKKMNS